MRERLIGLIADKWLSGVYDMADHLLANGVVLLPCRVGGKVYIISRNKVKECEVVFVGISADEKLSYFNVVERYADGRFRRSFYVSCCEIGRTIFLTREEAEQALKGGEG